jgi:hypothetical protein
VRNICQRAILPPSTRCSQLEHCRLIAAEVRIECRAHQLYVLLRQRSRSTRGGRCAASPASIFPAASHEPHTLARHGWRVTLKAATKVKALLTRLLGPSLGW